MFVVARWWDDGDQWTFSPADAEAETIDELHDPGSGWFLLCVDDVDWARWVEATTALERLEAKFLGDEGLDPEAPQRTVSCSSYTPVSGPHWSRSARRCTTCGHHGDFHATSGGEG